MTGQTKGKKIQLKKRKRKKKENEFLGDEKAGGGSAAGGQVCDGRALRSRAQSRPRGEAGAGAGGRGRPCAGQGGGGPGEALRRAGGGGRGSLCAGRGPRAPWDNARSPLVSQETCLWRRDRGPGRTGAEAPGSLRALLAWGLRGWQRTHTHTETNNNENHAPASVTSASGPAGGPGFPGRETPARETRPGTRGAGGGVSRHSSEGFTPFHSSA